MAEIISSTTMNVEKNENKEIKDSCKENELPSNLKSQMINEIISTKVGNTHSTPNKVNNRPGFNNTSSANEDNNSPKKNTYLFNQKDLLKSPLFKSPIFKRRDKTVDTTQTDIHSPRKRTISVNSDYDTFKLELCNTENFEAIDLLHDLDSVVKFDKDTLLSMMDVSVMQEDDGLSEANKDPATDPLSISDNEKENPDTCADSDSKSDKEQSKVESKSQVKGQYKYHFRKRKHKLNTNKEHLLEELENSEKWEEMPLFDIKKLIELHIKMTHDVPLQHKIELSGSHAPTMKERMLFEKHGPMRKGSYTLAEDKIIRKNWETFCELHDWDTKKTEPFLCWRHKGRYFIQDVKERQKFVQFLANGLPWRTLYSVHSRFKVLYRNKITNARYTSTEDRKILRYIRNKHLKKRDTKYAELAKILGRTNRSIFKRYQYLQNQNQDKSKMEPLVDVRWTLPLIKKFIKTLLNVTLSEDIMELKSATLPKPVWQKMEEKLNISQNVLKTFWQHQLHLQLFSTNPIYLNDIKIQLIEYIYAKGISSTREIIWSNVAKYFDGATAVFLCKIFSYLVQECNMNDVDNFADVVDYLYRIKIPEIVKAPTDKFLPKIIYENGKVSLVNEDDKIVTIDNDETDQDTDLTDS